MFMKKLPVPDATPEQKLLVGKFVDYILYIKNTKNGDASHISLMISYFEKIIDALIYELFLTEEIHAAEKYFFKPLDEEALPSINEMKRDKLAEIRLIFDGLFDRGHVIRQNIFFLDTLESVRIIEGKA